MIKIRNFSLSDLDQILEIEKKVFPKDAYSKSFFEWLYWKYPDGFLVVKNDEKILGYIIGHPEDGSALLISMAIDPNFRRKGIGRKLLNTLLDHFQKKKIKEIILHVRTKNKPAINFYEKMGFKTIEIVKNHYQNGEDAYLMEKTLGG